MRRSGRLRYRWRRPLGKCARPAGAGHRTQRRRHHHPAQPFQHGARGGAGDFEQGSYAGPFMYTGTTGDDTFVAVAGNQGFDGLGGTDTIDMANAGAGGAVVDLQLRPDGIAVSAATGVDTLASVENVKGALAPTTSPAMTSPTTLPAGRRRLPLRPRWRRPSGRRRWRRRHGRRRRQ